VSNLEAEPVSLFLRESLLARDVLIVLGVLCNEGTLPNEKAIRLQALSFTQVVDSLEQVCARDAFQWVGDPILSY
jgi:hypothetical protein